ncbi:helix-turn-helix transcriptional regulator [Krasilnikovia sp. MM14-A1259]|uniref:helix-turn-helix transcriptional regulator n=1 Tax=Krasilnikovia sp. MM14-A1259 TaxID=3373539 RepID=UPI0037FC9D72
MTAKQDPPRNGPNVLAGEPGIELARLVRSWRERLDPTGIPGLVTATRRRKTVSQEEIARLIGVSAVWYGNLERGERVNYSDDFLDRTAYALRLSEPERMMLYLYAVGREPAARRRSTTVELTDVLQRIIESQPWPAYISDEAWDLVAYNQHMADWFPWVGYESNVMRWVFTYNEARQQLVDWETAWAPLMLAQMRVANARNPSNMRLANLIREICRVNPDARRLWEHETTVYVHPDGDHRRLHLPYHHQVKDIEIVALAPLRAANVRLMMLPPLDGGR